jgi:hypothetical protein
VTPGLARLAEKRAVLAAKWKKCRCPEKVGIPNKQTSAREDFSKFCGNFSKKRFFFPSLFSFVNRSQKNTTISLVVDVRLVLTTR